MATPCVSKRCFSNQKDISMVVGPPSMADQPSKDPTLVVAQRAFQLKDIFFAEKGHQLSAMRKHRPTE